jgi:hypothetical protein
MATSVFYNRDLEKEKKEDKQQGMLITTLKVASSGSGPNPDLIPMWTGRPFPEGVPPEEEAASRTLPHL